MNNDIEAAGLAGNRLIGRRIRSDVLIAGAGLGGLTCALKMTQSGFRTAFVDPRLANWRVADQSVRDNRVTALLEPAVEFYRSLGVWQEVEKHAAPLSAIRIIVASAEANEGDLEVAFHAGELGQSRFGWSVPNARLSEVIERRLAEADLAQALPGRLVAMVQRTNEIFVTLDSRLQIQAKLVVAADGRESPTRSLAGIGCRTIPHERKAVVFDVSHSVDHGDASLEIHHQDGALTFVPIPDVKGECASAVVWIARSKDADALAALPAAKLEELAQKQGRGILGRLSVLTRPRCWPLTSQLAKRFYGERVALIAEAAHVFPPIAAQGFNSSVGDVWTLAGHIGSAGADPGRRVALQRYHRARYAEVSGRLAGVTLLSLSSMTPSGIVKRLRKTVLQSISASGTARRSLMRLGMGGHPLSAMLAPRPDPRARRKGKRSGIVDSRPL